MDFRATEQTLLTWTGEVLWIGFFEETTQLTGEIAALNDRLGGFIGDVLAESEFKAKEGNSLVARTGQADIRKIGLIGLGKPTLLTADLLRRSAAAIAKLTRQEKARHIGLSLPLIPTNPALTAQAIVEGLILALHQDQRFKSEPDTSWALAQVDILGVAGSAAAIAQAEQICQGVILARELVNAPPNIATPIALAETAMAIAQAPQMSLTILEQSDCEALGMGAYLGVAQASDLPPKFIHLVYTPAGGDQQKVAIVGKGLTFDSGGLNIKVAGSGIETMKMDMGGAAATLGAAQAIAQLQPPGIEVHFISAVTENMISGRALHPGDILTASNGKTIEVNNTDAEGRLTLADALVYAEKLGVAAIVDLATLTGACMIALGDDIAGLWSTDESLAQNLMAATTVTGEKLWQMPLEDRYFEGMKSHVADMKNTGPRPGGAITAALFLKQFVTATPWAHIDIAGPAWTEKESGYLNAGGTGYGVRTLVQWVLSQAAA